MADGGSFTCEECGREFDYKRSLVTHLTHANGEPWHDVERLEELYYGRNYSLTRIAEELGCARQTISNIFDDLGLEKRDESERSSLQHLRRPLNIRHDEKGYLRIVHRHRNETDRIRLHRLVAMAEWGVDAVKDSVVHHKNGIPWDNRPSNLELFDDTAEHVQEHAYGQIQSEMRYREKEVLETLYVDLGLSARHIADVFKCKKTTILRWLRKHDIEPRSKN